MKKLSSLFIITMLVVATPPAQSAEQKWLADTPSTSQIVIKADPVVKVGTNVRIQYEYIYNDSTERVDSSPQWDWDMTGKHYEILMGPSLSTSSSFSIVNGKETSSYKQTFIFILTFPKVGLYTLPTMTATTVAGKTVKSGTLSIRATDDTSSKGQAAKDNTSSKEQTAKRQTPPAFNKDDVLAVEATADKTHISLGDSVEVSIRLYTTANVTGMNAKGGLALDNAFWHEADLSNQKNLETVDYKGKTVESVLWQKFSVVPLQPGKIVLNPRLYTVTATVKDENADPFDAFFNGSSAYVTKDTLIASNPIEIRVTDKPLSPSSAGTALRPSSHSLGLVIDRSSSLLAKVGSDSPSFMEIENRFIESLTEGNGIKDYSVTYFAGRPHFATPQEQAAITKVYRSEGGRDGSAVYDAILVAALHDGALTADHGPYSVLLLTDGSDNASHLAESTLVNLLLRHHIRVDVVAFGTNNSKVYYPYSKEQEWILPNNQDFSEVRSIAKATGGTFVFVSNMERVAEAVNKVKVALQRGDTPDQEPEYDFAPNESLLQVLYNELMTETSKDF